MIIMTVTKEKTMKPSVERRRKIGEFNGMNNVMTMNTVMKLNSYF